jgi:ribosomal protein S18 acetylase RimI-like enzyme
MQSHLYRLATKEDAPELARLLTELGHPTSTGSIRDMWDLWVFEGNSAFVAAVNERLLGLATMHRMIVLHRTKPVGRITALVVDPACRSQGIGRALVAHAEVALAQAGCGLLEITTNPDRVEAMAFYEAIGYQRKNVRLSKDLDQF